jgi:hypothetical protein
MSGKPKDDISTFIDELMKSDEVDKMSQEDLEKARRTMANKLYGVVVPPTRKFANISIINWREDYMKKVIMTGLIGYIFRLVKEYDEYDIPEDMLKALGRERSLEILKANNTKFLKRNFNYNPDYHVDTVYKENLDDPERVKLAESMKLAMSNSTSPSSPITVTVRDFLASETKSEESAKMVLKMHDAAVENMQFVYSKSAEIGQEIEKAANVIKDLLKTGAFDNLGLDDIYAFLATSADKFNSLKAQTREYCSSAELYSNVPPTDVFHHFDRYLANHYEQIRDAVTVLYANKPDIEFAVQFYNSFDDEKEAETHRKSNETSIISPIFTVSNENWTLMGPFKQNREKLEFYNKNTEILKRMFDQHKKDQELGTELMKKRVKVEKGKNIAIEGPDDPGLEKYQEAVGVIETLGAKKVLTKEEKDKLVNAQRLKEMAEVPSNAIQVDVFKTDNDGKFSKSKFYTESETPKPAPEESERVPVVKSRQGTTMTLEDLKRQAKEFKSEPKQ